MNRLSAGKLFDGLSDTLRILTELAEGSASTPLIQIAEILERAANSPPTTLTAARWCLEQLLQAAALVVTEVETIEPDPGSLLRWWALAFADQCRDALDELTLLCSLDRALVFFGQEDR